MSKENPKRGASRIHGELLMLGFEVAQSTVSKYMAQGGPLRVVPDVFQPCDGRWQAGARIVYPSRPTVAELMGSAA
jgi:hypothetical protein